MHREKKFSHFDLKSWVTGGIIIWPGKVSNWRIFESIWLSMLRQLTLNVESTDPQCWANLTLLLSKLDSQCWVNLTLNVESIWLNVESIWRNVESIWFNVESIRLLMLSQFYSNILQLPNLPGRILVRQVTQLFMSKWLNFFLSVCIIACRQNYSELNDSTPQSINQDFGFSI